MMVVNKKVKVDALAYAMETLIYAGWLTPLTHCLRGTYRSYLFSLSSNAFPKKQCRGVLFPSVKP